MEAGQNPVRAVAPVRVVVGLGLELVSRGHLKVGGELRSIAKIMRHQKHIHIDVHICRGEWKVNGNAAQYIIR